jgi:hypothetical protein
MSNPLDAIKGAIESGNVPEALEKAVGTYTEKVKPGDEAGLPQTDMAKGTDPSPFSIGQLPK